MKNNLKCVLVAGILCFSLTGLTSCGGGGGGGGGDDGGGGGGGTNNGISAKRLSSGETLSFSFPTAVSGISNNLYTYKINSGTSATESSGSGSYSYTTSGSTAVFTFKRFLDTTLYTYTYKLTFTTSSSGTVTSATVMTAIGASVSSRNIGSGTFRIY